MTSSFHRHKIGTRMYVSVPQRAFSGDLNGERAAETSGGFVQYTTQLAQNQESMDE